LVVAEDLQQSIFRWKMKKTGSKLIAMMNVKALQTELIKGK